MNKKMNKTWIRLMAVALFVMMALPALSFAAGNSDGVIKDGIHKKLNPYEDVSISVDKGHVTLGGNVASNGEKAEAIARAKSVTGVSSVKDEIRVIGGKDAQSVGEFVDDAAITAKVKADFLTTRGLDSKSISVDTRDGVVMLTGSVKTANQANMAEQGAMKVKGVKRVDNRLIVK